MPRKNQTTRALAWTRLHHEVVACTRCPRLVGYRAQIAAQKRRQYRHEVYWGRPLPSFGDPDARLLIIGLAPAAHGGNRTGRMFTGDASGDWLARALHTARFANQPISRSLGDGLVLKDAYLTAAARCAPPDNAPTRDEFAACRPYLHREMALLTRVQVVVALGRLAFETYLTACVETGVLIPRPRPSFSHGATYRLSHGITVIASYHPSRQNTQTGRLTVSMLDSVFRSARRLVDAVG